MRTEAEKAEIKAADEAMRAKREAAVRKAARLTKEQTRELWERVALRSERICFGIVYFTDEADAELLAARHVIERKKSPSFATYNGGWMHGAHCGRERAHDFTREDGTKLYACTY